MEDYNKSCSSTSKNLIKPTIQITCLSLLSILISFVTQLVIAYYFGASSERDSYFAAIVVPTYLVTVFTGSIGALYIPSYIDIEYKNGTARALAFSSNVMAGIVLISLLLIFICEYYCHYIVQISSPGFKSPTQIQLTESLFSIILVSVVFQLISAILGANLQIKSKFLSVAFSTLFVSASSLAFAFFLSESIGIYSLAIGMLVGTVFSTIFLLIRLKKIGFSFVSINLKDSDFVLLLRNSIPLLLAGLFYKLTTVFERGIASNLSAGSISFLGYASQIMLILTSITSSGIATILFPKLSRAWSEKDFSNTAKLLYNGIKFILLISIPISILFLFFAKNIVQFVFERGAFNHEATLAVSDILPYYMFIFIATSLGNIVVKVLYLSQKTKLASVINALETIVFIILAIFLSKYFSYKGIAIAFAFSTILSISISSWVMIRVVHSFDFRYLLLDMMKIFLSSFIAAIPLYCINVYFNIPNSIFVVVMSVFFSIVYLLTLYLLGSKDVVFIFKILKK